MAKLYNVKISGSFVIAVDDHIDRSAAFELAKRTVMQAVNDMSPSNLVEFVSLVTNERLLLPGWGDGYPYRHGNVPEMTCSQILKESK